jgi:hypothetical protein
MKFITKFSTPCFGQYMPSFFRSVKLSDSTPLDWQTFYHMVTTDTTLQANTDIARKAFESGDAHKYAVMKALSGAITPAAQCDGGHAVKNIVGLTGVAMVDLDHIPDDLMQRTLALVRSNPKTFFCGITASGRGLRILARYTADTPDLSYLEAWRTVNDYFSTLTGLPADEATKDPSRLSFLAFDADAILNPDSEYFVVTAATPAPRTTAGTATCHVPPQKRPPATPPHLSFGGPQETATHRRYHVPAERDRLPDRHQRGGRCRQEETIRTL